MRSCIAILMLASIARAAVAQDADSPALTIAREIETSFTRGDGSAFARRCDDVAFLRRSLDGFAINEQGVARFAKRVSLGRTVGAQVSATVRGGGTYRLLRVRETDAGPRAIMRLLAEDGIDYHELVLAADASGGLRIVDLRVHSSGEMMSRTVRRAILPGLLARHPALAEKVEASDRLLMRYAPRIAIAERFAAEGRRDAAAAVLAALPAEALRQPPVYLRHIEWTDNPQQRAEAVKDYLAAHADTSPLDLLLLKLASGSPMRTWAYESADRLEAVVGPDGALDLMRSRAAAAADDSAASMMFAERALERAPDLPDVYYPLIDRAVAAKDHARTAALLLAAEKDAGVVWGDLAQIESFKAFVASPQFERWKADRAAVHNEPRP